MRVIKFIISVVCITLIALIYVHQQVELVKLSYAIDFKEKNLERILDRKENLLYNIKELENPSRLEKVLEAERIAITFPRRDQLVKVSNAWPHVKTAESLKTVGLRKINIFKLFEFIGPRAEAQAKEK